MRKAQIATIATILVLALWPAVLELVGAENKMLSSLLAQARPVAVGDGELRVAFASSNSFLKRKAEDSAHRATVTVPLRELTGIDNGFVVCGGLELPEPNSAGTKPEAFFHAPGLLTLGLRPRRHAHEGVDLLVPVRSQRRIGAGSEPHGVAGEVVGGEEIPGAGLHLDR